MDNVQLTYTGQPTADQSQLNLKYCMGSLFVWKAFGRTVKIVVSYLTNATMTLGQSVYMNMVSCNSHRLVIF